MHNLFLRARFDHFIFIPGVCTGKIDRPGVQNYLQVIIKYDFSFIPG